MLKEIDEQPTVMRKLIRFTDEAGQVVVDSAIIKAVQDDASTSLQLGTSYHAGFASKKMEELIDTCWTWNFIWGWWYATSQQKPLFIFISQSWNSGGRQVPSRLMWNGNPGISDSDQRARFQPFSREANHTMLLHAGVLKLLWLQPRPTQIAAFTFLAKAVGEAKR